MKTLMMILCAILLTACNDPNCSTDGCAGSTSTTGGSAGSAGQGGVGGSAGTGAVAGTASSVGGTSGSASVGGSAGSGGSCPVLDDANPCTNDTIAADECTPEHAAKPDGEICSVDAQTGRCTWGNCLVGLLPLPSCPVVSTMPALGAWIARFIPFDKTIQLAGGAAIIPLTGGCSSAPRKLRLSIPVDQGSPQAASPEGVPLAREVTIDPSDAWVGDGAPWLGGREDGLLSYGLGKGVWVELEIPDGACAATCDDASVPTGFACASASPTALSDCAPSSRFLIAPLGF